MNIEMRSFFKDIGVFQIELLWKVPTALLIPGFLYNKICSGQNAWFHFSFMSLWKIIRFSYNFYPLWMGIRYVKKFFGLDFLLSNNLFCSSCSPLVDGFSTRQWFCSCFFYYKFQVMKVVFFEEKSQISTYLCWTPQTLAIVFPFAVPLVCVYIYIY